MDIRDYAKHKPGCAANGIIGRLKAENARDFSDSELERCLDPCCGNLTDLAKQLRDAGLLVETKIEYKTATWPFPVRQRETPNADVTG
ncbi:MAG: hypothetical protein WAW87_03855 [Candidatus Ferrigenium altingense]